MIGVCILLAGMAIGASIAVAVVYHLPAPARPVLPPATARQVDRARRRNRADLRHMLPARDQGVRMAPPRARPRDAWHVEPLHDVDSFDREPTHG